MAPTTLAFVPAAPRASSAAARLIFSVSSASPKLPSFRGFAPNVLVSRISAPARMYSSCTSRTSRGCFTLSSS